MSPVLKPILLVDDNPKDVELTLAALEKSGLTNPIVVARDGVEALDYLFRDSNIGRGTAPALLPAVMLLDIKLPLVDGFEVIERVRASLATRHLPVVMLTSSREKQDVIRSYDLGVNAFVVKPVGYRDLSDAVRNLGIVWTLLNKPGPNGEKLCKPNGSSANGGNDA